MVWTMNRRTPSASQGVSHRSPSGWGSGRDKANGSASATSPILSGNRCLVRLISSLSGSHVQSNTSLCIYREVATGGSDVKKSRCADVRCQKTGLHDSQKVGEGARTVRVRPTDSDHLVVPDAVAQQRCDAFDARLESVGQLLIAGRGRRRFVGYQTDLRLRLHQRVGGDAQVTLVAAGAGADGVEQYGLTARIAPSPWRV